jgi:hypothetical protein
MTRFKTLTFATLLACAAGGAMAQTAGGGGSSGDGGGSLGYDAPTMAIQIPGIPQSRVDAQRDSVVMCRFEVIRGHYCESVRTR